MFSSYKKFQVHAHTSLFLDSDQLNITLGAQKVPGASVKQAPVTKTRFARRMKTFFSRNLNYLT